MKRLSKGKRFIVGCLDAIGKPIFAVYRFFGGGRSESHEGIRRVLVLELWGIGDVVMATPALAAVRRAFPESTITLLAKSHAEALLAGGSLADEVVAYDFPWTALTGKYRLARYDFAALRRLILRLRRKRFDLAIDARMDFRNNLLMFLIGARRRVGYDYGGGGYFLNDVVSVNPTQPHRVDEWLGLLQHLGVAVKGLRPQLWVNPEDQEKAPAALESRGVKAGDLIIGIHPGARSAVRRWDLHKFAVVGDTLVERYQAKILVLLDPDGYGAQIPMRNAPILLQPTLRELKAFIGLCHLMICNDSGPMHIATAVETPVVAVFGPQKPEWFGPYGEGHRVVLQDNFPCRPCFDQCIFDRPYCITTITPQQVLLVVEEQLGRLRVDGHHAEVPGGHDSRMDPLATARPRPAPHSGVEAPAGCPHPGTGLPDPKRAGSW